MNPNIVLTLRHHVKSPGKLLIHSPICLPILAPEMASIQEVMAKGPHDPIGKSLIIISHLQIRKVDKAHKIFGIIQRDANP